MRLISSVFFALYKENGGKRLFVVNLELFERLSGPCKIPSILGIVLNRIFEKAGNFKDRKTIVKVKQMLLAIDNTTIYSCGYFPQLLRILLPLRSRRLRLRKIAATESSPTKLKPQNKTPIRPKKGHQKEVQTVWISSSPGFWTPFWARFAGLSQQSCSN